MEFEVRDVKTDNMKITARYYLLLGILVCFIFLTIFSFLMMSYLQLNESPKFQLATIVTLHSIWYTVGGVGLLGAYLLGIAYPNWVSRVFLGVAISILGSAFLLGKLYHGLPYLYLGKLCINATEVSAIALLIPLGIFMARFRYHFLVILPPGILLFLFLLIGSDNATMCLGLVVATLAWIIYREKRKTYSLFLVLYSLGIAITSILKQIVFLADNNSELILGLYRFVLYDFTTGANGHTEFILSHVVEKFGIIAAVGCVVLVLLIIAQLSALASTLKRRASAFAMIGFAAFLLGQIIFNLLVVTGIVRNPPSGVFVPFVNYGGSQLVVQLVAIGALLGFCNEEKATLAGK